MEHSITSAVRPGPRSLASQALPCGHEGRLQETGLSGFSQAPASLFSNIWSQTSALRLCRTVGASLAPICCRPRRPPHLCPASPEPQAGSHGPARARAPICRGGCPGGGCFREVRARNKARVLASFWRGPTLSQVAAGAAPAKVHSQLCLSSEHCRSAGDISLGCRFL